MHDHIDTAKGLGAVALNVLALITSTQEHLEWALRCSSLILGSLVAAVTLWNLIRSRRGRE
jgi:hypothetical protein